MKNLNRRKFLQDSGLLASSLCFANFPLPAWATDDDDHFYIQFVISGGWDPTYLFDGRPLEMTQNKLLQNYLGKAPKKLTGQNGGECWRTELTDSLMKHWDSFSVVNGVVMASSFDGHGQNMNYLFTGNPFGGASFLPHLAKEGKYSETSIVGIQNSSLYVQANNHGEIVPLAGEPGQRLVNYLKKNPMVDINEPGFAFIRDRFQLNAQSGGKFSLANRELIKSMEKQEQLYNQFKNISFGNATTDPIQADVDLMTSVFSKKVARVALINITPQGEDPNQFLNIDTHSGLDAVTQPQIYSSIAKQLTSYLDLMRQADMGNGNSLLDSTTFMVGSEFSRTMRQAFPKFEETGTDHNSLTNSLIIGGKGIKAGHVIGRSDFQDSHSGVSKAHLEKDPNQLKIMGDTFDFSNQKPAGSSPQVFDVNEYLNMQSVANSLMSLFGVPSKNHWKLTNSGGPAPILSSLLK